MIQVGIDRIILLMIIKIMEVYNHDKGRAY